MKTAFIDLDDTIIDTARLKACLWQIMAEQSGKSISEVESTYAQMRDEGVDFTPWEHLYRLTGSRRQDERSLFISEISQHAPELMKPYWSELITVLRNQNYSPVILTRGSQEYQNLKLDVLDEVTSQVDALHIVPEHTGKGAYCRKVFPELTQVMLIDDKLSVRQEFSEAYPSAPVYESMQSALAALRNT